MPKGGGGNRWRSFAWGVLVFLIAFHTLNNLVVLKLDRSYFTGTQAILYSGTIDTLVGLSGKSFFQQAKTLYFNIDFWHYPGLFGTISMLIMALFGFSQDISVMANVPFIIVLIVATYLSGKEIFNREVGLISAVLVSFFPSIMGFSRTYRVDFALTAMVMACIFTLILSRNLSRRRESILFGTALGLTALVQPSFIIYLIGPTAALLAVPLFRELKENGKRNVKQTGLNIIMVILIAFLIAGPWYASHFNDTINRFIEARPETPITGNFNPSSFFQALGFFNPLFSLSVLILAPFAWLAILATIHYVLRWREHRMLILTWIVLPYIFFLNIDYKHWTWMPRHFLPVLPAVALIIALLLNESFRFVSKHISSPKMTIKSWVVILIIVDAVFFLTFTYWGGGNLEKPFKTEIVGKERMIRTEQTGILSPYKMGFETEELWMLLEREWSTKNEVPKVWFLNPGGMVSEDAILGHMETLEKLGHVRFVEENCLGDWCGESKGGERKRCEDTIHSADYLILEPIRRYEITFDNPEVMYAERIEPLMLHIQESLPQYTVLTILTPRLDPTSPYAARHPAFDWLNESVWILKKNSLQAEQVCEGKATPLERDMYYWDRCMRTEDCAEGGKEIADPYLEYVFMRTWFRAHMLEFMSHRGLPERIPRDGIVDMCDGFDAYEQHFCIYTDAARLAKADLEEAEVICGRLGNEQFEGECLFFIASSLIMGENNWNSEDIESLRAFCRKIDHQQWQAECHFLIADELALQAYEGHLDEMAEICTESSNLEFYSCHGHVARLLPAERMLEFCGLADGIFRECCFFEMGERISDTLTDADTLDTDLSLAIDECNEFPEEFRGKCIYKLGGTIGSLSGETEEAIEMCDRFPEEFKHECFNGMGVGLGEKYADDIPVGLAECDRFPAEFRENCFRGFSWALGFRFIDEISLGVEKCREFPDGLEHICFDGLSTEVNRRYGDDRVVGAELCDMFPEEYREDCHDTLDEEVDIRFIFRPG